MWHLPSRVGAAPSGLGQHGISPPAASPVSGPCSISCPGTVQHLPFRDSVASPILGVCSTSHCESTRRLQSAPSPTLGQHRISHLGTPCRFPPWDHGAHPIFCGLSVLGPPSISHLRTLWYLPSGERAASPILGPYGTSHLVWHLPSRAASPISGPCSISCLRTRWHLPSQECQHLLSWGRVAFPTLGLGSTSHFV